ncbi:MAG TPA: hypothetical protein VIK53_14615 [Verrucomicrobiae bacterium]
MKNWIVRSLIAAGLFASLTQGVRAAVTFTNTPSAVSNTYSGLITLSIGGLTNTETVVVQKFLDANTNGVIDGNDLLVQQFTLTDGMNFVIGGVTNFNVPGDLNATTGAITAMLNFQNGDFVQNIIGHYFYKLSSPVGHFAPITNSFSVTNFPFAQKFTGNVVSNSSSTTLPNAVVLLFPPPRPGKNGPGGNPVAGVVANSAGAYTVQAPPGTYTLVALTTNYVGNFKKAPVLTLGSGQTINTNLSATNATASITGKIVDAANNAIGLPGVFLPLQSTNGLLAFSYSDTNGNFTARVTAGQWSLGSDDSGLIIHGYVGWNNNTNVNSGATGVTLAYAKANALFYGSVKDNLGNPLAGIDVNAYDNNNYLYQTDGYTDANGNYVVGVLGGLGSNDPWWIGISSDSSPANYIFSQPAFDQNGGTNISVGQAVLANFTAIIATNQITGNVKFNGTNLTGVGVYAYATISGVTFNAFADTDANGNYSLTVANGSWNVGVNQNGGNDTLDNILGSGNYQLPNERNVNINNNAGMANFTIQPCSGLQILTSSPLPDAQQGNSYYFQLQASSCSGNGLTWSVNDPANFPYGLNMNLDSVGEVFGTPTGSGTFSFSVHVDDGNGHSADSNMSLTITPVASSLQVTTASIPNATNTVFYSQTLQASGGTLPYTWSIAGYSALPSNLTLATNGVLSGTPATAVDTYYFDVVVNDAAANASTQTLSLAVVNPPSPPLVITNASLPNGNVGVPYSAQLGATGGQSPYSWSYAIGSINLSSVGLTLYSGGLISGIPTTNKVSTFKVQATDANFTTTNKILSIIINPDPVLASPNWLTNRFQMLLIGASNQNYTLQLSTNLGSTNWASLFITNSATTNSFILSDPNATNKQRFYRVLIGP